MGLVTQPNHPPKNSRLLTPILFLLFLAIAPAAHAADMSQGYRDMYNRNFTAAHIVFADWIAAHPEDPFGPASDAAAYLFSEFDSRNIIDVQLFNDTSTTPGKNQLPSNPNLRSDFDRRTGQAEKLADAILAKNANDAQALFVKMFIYGLRADYAEMLDKSDFKALKYSKVGARYSDLALAADPQLYDAHIATGFENYMLSLKPAPVRFIARLLGGQTDKAKVSANSASPRRTASTSPPSPRSCSRSRNSAKATTPKPKPSCNPSPASSPKTPCTPTRSNASTNRIAAPSHSFQTSLDRAKSSECLRWPITP